MSENTLEQLRAKHALDSVSQVKEQPCKDDYANAAKALPATILMTSLGNTLATLLASAKGKESHGGAVLYQHIEAWLLRDGPRKPLEPHTGNLIGALVATSEVAYERASDEALAYVGWIKKFVQAFMPAGRD